MTRGVECRQGGRGRDACSPEKKLLLPLPLRPTTTLCPDLRKDKKIQTVGRGRTTRRTDEKGSTAVWSEVGEGENA